MAKSSELPDVETLPWVNSWVTCLSKTPWPMLLEDFCRGDVAKMSPKSALERLKPEVPTLAMLLEVTDSCDAAEFRPVSEV